MVQPNHQESSLNSLLTKTLTQKSLPSLDAYQHLLTTHLSKSKPLNKFHSYFYCTLCGKIVSNPKRCAQCLDLYCGDCMKENSCDCGGEMRCELSVFEREYLNARKFECGECRE